MKRGFRKVRVSAFVLAASLGVTCSVQAAQRGDADGDHDIDLKDLAGFQRCFCVPPDSCPPLTADCQLFDFNADGLVNLLDLALFAGCDSGTPPTCGGAFLGPGVIPPQVTDSAIILGRVLNAETDQPLQGAQITAVYYPATEDEPPLKCGGSVCMAISRGDGSFQFQTPPILGSEMFLLRVRKPGFAENLRRVPLMAGRCWRIDDAVLNPVNPPVPVEKEKGATLTEPTGKVTLEIPPNALMQDSMISVTPLGTHEAVRDELPELVATAGTFVDIAGVFGEATAPGTVVTLRVPNQYNLPVGTPLPFGKIDHNTLEWMDLREAFGGPKDHNIGMGEVKSDGSGGTFIEVQFDHFCTVCTGYCLPYPTPSGGNGSGGNPSGPGNSPPVCGSSAIQQREGFLQEDVLLPSFQQMGRSWELGLAYNSAAANPSVTLSASVNYNSARPVERTHFDFAIEGVRLQAFYDRSQNNQKPVGTFFWNGKNGLGNLQPTGAYPYSIVATSLNANAPVAISNTFGGEADFVFIDRFYPGIVPFRAPDITGRAVLVNLRNSPYGAGWSVVNEHRLEFDPDGCVVLVHGNADWRLFSPTASDPDLFDSPAGEFSTLRRQADGSYRREFTEGTKHFFNGLGGIDRIVDRYGYVTNFAYDGGLLTQVTSPTGYSYSLEYGGGKLSRIVDSAGRQSKFQINGAGDLVSATDPEGATRTFAYDANHLLVGQSGARGERSEYEYANGRVVEARSFDIGGGPLLRTRSFDPSTLNGEASAAVARGQGTINNPIPVVVDRVDRYIDGREFPWVNESDTHGDTIRSVDPLNRFTQYAYDANRLMTSRTMPNSAKTTYEYDNQGYITKMTEIGDPATTADDGITTFEYNGPFHRVSKVVDPNGKSSIFEYLATNGSLSCIEDALNNRMCFFYEDTRFPDLVTRIVDALNNPTTLTYDAHGHVVTISDPLNRTTRAEYDPATGNLVTVTDPRPTQPTTRFGYDNLNQVIQIVDAIGGVTNFVYGEQSCACTTENLTRVVFPATAEHGRTEINYEYDGLNRLTKTIDQLDHFSTYAYDAEGNPTSWTNRNGDTGTYSYDAAGQLQEKDVPGSGVTTYQYDPLGSISAAANGVSSLGFVYDQRGRMTQATQSLVPTPDEPVPLFYVINYQYDRASNRTRMQTPDNTVQYTYDDLHRLRTLTETSPGDPASYVWTFSYDELSRRTRLDAPNGTHTEYAYDAASQVTSILHKNAQGQAFSGVQYAAYDEAGNSTAQTWIQSAGPFELAYSYDKLSRLITSTPPPAADATFIACAYHYDGANRLTDDCEFMYTFDDEGRQTEKRSNSEPLTTGFDYDAEDRLREIRQEYGDPVPERVMTATYAYDPLGRRIEKSVNGVATRFLYDREDILAVMDGANAQIQRYTHGPRIDEPVSLFDVRASERSFYHADRLGSILAQTNEAGLLDREQSFDAFGAVVAAGVPSLLFSFTGREVDHESGLLFYRARYYGSTVGRFLAEDPLGMSGGLNFYTYVGNNPSNRIDPFGLESCPLSEEDLRKDILRERARGLAGISGVPRVLGGMALDAARETAPLLPFLAAELTLTEKIIKWLQLSEKNAQRGEGPNRIEEGRRRIDRRLDDLFR